MALDPHRLSRIAAAALACAAAAFLNSPLSALASDPLISAEFGLDQPLAGPAPCTRAAPLIAANDSGYLVVWTHGNGLATSAAVYAARLSLAGELLDPFGILVSDRAAEQTGCAVAAGPDAFLVVWSAPHGTSVSDWDILGARIQADGTVIDSQPLTVCGQAGTVQSSPAVAGNGDNYLVVWRDSRSTGIYGAWWLPTARFPPLTDF